MASHGGVSMSLIDWAEITFFVFHGYFYFWLCFKLYEIMVSGRDTMYYGSFTLSSYGSFPPTEMETEMDPCTESFPEPYIVLCRTFSTGTEMEMDPCMETFPDCYCTHFRDGSLSQGQISVPILLYFNKGIGIHLHISGKTCLVQ